MKVFFKYLKYNVALAVCFMHSYAVAQSPEVGKLKYIIYHQIHTDKDGGILPWYNNDAGTSYDFTLNSVWNYWKNIPGHWVRSVGDKTNYPEWKKELPFPPKYLIFRTLDDMGVGGDQFAMMLSSFNLYYDYTGNVEVLKNMIFQANWYLKYGFSGANDAWPNIPYPCNTTEAPVYDGDLILGKGFTQPDKAGSFGAELMMLYQKTGDKKYLDAATKIANTLAKYTNAGDYDHSPIPFKVQAITGEIKSQYCTNWTGTMRLFESLVNLGSGDTVAYKNAYNLINNWMLKYPVKNDRWGPFFEDITAWSDTEINEATFAWFILTHSEEYPEWKTDVRHMQNWAINNLGINYWKQYGFTAMGEQSVYKIQGQSHTSRHASVELLYASKTGDNSKTREAARQLNFCTYAVDNDGKCRWMNFDTYEIWWTDGYGDFMRHFLRSMAANPNLAPSYQDHILSTTSVLQTVIYAPAKNKTVLNYMDRNEYKRLKIYYKAFGNSGQEEIRLVKKPFKILIDKVVAHEIINFHSEGYLWIPMAKGGLLKINRKNGNSVTILQ